MGAIVEALIAMLMVWIADNSSYETEDIPFPAVIELSPQALTREYYADSPKAIPRGGVDQNVLALYSWNEGSRPTVFLLGASHMGTPLSQEEGLENPWFQERLLHELVHHVQYYTGQYDEFECSQQGELEAYRLGGLYLTQQRVADPLPNRHWLSRMYSQC